MSNGELDLEVVVLATESEDNYRSFIALASSSPSASTAVGATRQHMCCPIGTTVSMGTVVSSGPFGRLKVVDMFPLTRGTVADSTAIVVVPPSSMDRSASLPPSAEGEPEDHDDDEAQDLDLFVAGAFVEVKLAPRAPPTPSGVFRCSTVLYAKAVELSGAPRDGGQGNEDTVVVLVDACGASSGSHRLVALQLGGVVTSRSGRMSYTMETSSAADWSNLRGWVDSNSGTAALSADPSAASFTVPLHVLIGAAVPCDKPLPLLPIGGRGLCSAVTEATAPVVALSRAVLTPALPHAVLVMLHGDSYADTIEKAMMQCGLLDALHGAILSEGDVISVPVPLCSGRGDGNNRNAMKARGCLDDVEMALQHLHQAAGSAPTGGVRAGLHSSAGESFLLVVSDASTRSLRGSGVFLCAAVGNTPATVTTVAFRSTGQPNVVATQWAAHTPRDCPAHEHPFTADVRAALRELSLAPFDLPSPCRAVVLNAPAENLGAACACCAAECCGYIPLVLDARALEDHALASLLDSCCSSPPTHCAAVLPVVRHAEVLQPQGLAMATLLGSRTSNKNSSSSGTDCGGGPAALYPPLAVVLWESMDPVSPRVASLSCNSRGLLRAAVPGEAERTHLVRFVARQWSDRVVLSRFLAPKVLSQWTSGLTAVDVMRFLQFTFTSLCCLRPGEMSSSSSNNGGKRFVLSYPFADECLRSFQRQHGHNVVSTKLQPVKWSDVGGLEEAKKEILESVQMPILYPELFASGAKRRAGILLYGPPGCGKTLLAKAVATELNMNFLSVKGPELINQYVGESEKNVRHLFQRARDNSPCIVFFDELDALAPARGAKGDAGGAMDRIVSQLLVEVDGVTSKKSDGTDSGLVFIIGATNRPDLLDSSLLRPGRFDRLCYLGVPSTKDEQLFAVKALTRKFNLAQDVNLPLIVEPLDFVFTGADFFALCSDAMMLSVEEQIQKAQAKIAQKVAATSLKSDTDGSNEDEDEEEEEEPAEELSVRMEHFITARSKLKASVTKADLKKYEALRSKFTAAAAN